MYACARIIRHVPNIHVDGLMHLLNLNRSRRDNWSRSKLIANEWRVYLRFSIGDIRPEKRNEQNKIRRVTTTLSYTQHNNNNWDASESNGVPTTRRSLDNIVALCRTYACCTWRVVTIMVIIIRTFFSRKITRTVRSQKSIIREIYKH